MGVSLCGSKDSVGVKTVWKWKLCGSGDSVGVETEWE